MWYTGCIAARNERITAMDNIFRMTKQETIDAIDNFLGENDFPEPDIALKVSRVAQPITDNDLAQLRNRVDVLRPSESFGIDIYVEVVKFITECLSH